MLIAEATVESAVPIVSFLSVRLQWKKICVARNFEQENNKASGHCNLEYIGFNFNYVNVK